MKTVEEYTEEVIDLWGDFDWDKVSFKEFRRKVSELFEQAQKGAYNQAIDDALTNISAYIMRWRNKYDYSAGVEKVKNPDIQDVLNLKKE